MEAEAAAAAARAELEQEGAAGRGGARRGVTRKQLSLEDGLQVAAPFTLWSIGEAAGSGSMQQAMLAPVQQCSLQWFGLADCSTAGHGLLGAVMQQGRKRCCK